MTFNGVLLKLANATRLASYNSSSLVNVKLSGIVLYEYSLCTCSYSQLENACILYVVIAKTL